MNINYPFKEPDSISSLTPLMDVLFLLLIFFMLTTTFHKRDSEIKIKSLQMPQARISSALSQKDLLTVSISRTGEFFVDDIGYRKNMVEARVKAGIKDKKSLVISADKFADFQDVMHVYDIIQVLGIGSFSHQIIDLP